MQQQQGQPACMQQQPLQDCPDSSSSRDLSSSLASAAHQVHQAEQTLHHITHPMEGLKYYTVGRLKREVKARINRVVNQLVDKVLP